jgi:hypothetical protein
MIHGRSLHDTGSFLDLEDTFRERDPLAIFGRLQRPAADVLKWLVGQAAGT